MNIYDTTNGGTQAVAYTFNRTFEFVSHARKVQNHVIFVQNHKSIEVVILSFGLLYVYYPETRPSS